MHLHVLVRSARMESFIRLCHSVIQEVCGRLRRGLTSARVAAQCEFPLGGLHKEAVRRRAADAGIPTAAKRSSAGICFIGALPACARLGSCLVAIQSTMTPAEIFARRSFSWATLLQLGVRAQSDWIERLAHGPIQQLGQLRSCTSSKLLGCRLPTLSRRCLLHRRKHAEEQSKPPAGRRSFGDFLAQYIEPCPGRFVCVDGGADLGPCPDVLAVTHGQRAGVGGAPQRWGNHACFPAVPHPIDAPVETLGLRRC